MRTAAIGATLCFAFAACSTTSGSQTDSPYQQPNSLMAVEITRRVEQIPYQHREELLQNLMWLAQAGEQTVPALLEGLRHENPKVRSSVSWVLGRLRDRRTIPNLQAAVRDSDATVRLECARTLVLLGDLAHSPCLIEGLDSERKEVRYLCHEALKTATGHDFGYDHLNGDKAQMLLSVLRWRQWWSEYSGDVFFAQNYQQKHGLAGTPAAPAGEVQMGEPQAQQPSQAQQPQAGESEHRENPPASQGANPQATNPAVVNEPPANQPPAPANEVTPPARPVVVPAPTPAPTPRGNGQ